MKKLLIILLILPIFNYCQIIKKNDLTGIWQFKNKEIGSGFTDTYQFFRNDTFIFNTSQFDGLQRVVSIKGKYEIKGDSLLLKLESTKERVGGSIVRSEINTLSDSWEIQDYKMVERKLPVTEKQNIVLEKCNNNEKACLLFDKRIYYKVDINPENYR
jgi:hypothetical protein